jgi:photosystem II cytochrome c550|mmetsp:Transcript_44151/g.96372  ORF Transcript_44151/g.96372 Transcript_44151/m.96372 type:complete len:216 (+) Transcript_44151:67-714(+)
MAGRVVATGVAATCLLAGLSGAFVAPTGAPQQPQQRAASFASLASAAPAAEETSFWSSAARFAAGGVLGAVMLLSAGPARADVEDVSIPIDGKGKTVNMTKEQVVRGKRLFNAACAVCHVGGGTRTNQNVGLALDELAGALPPRDTVDSIVDYLNNPTSYDGLRDVSEVHPSIRSADVFPKMRSMKQQDLYDISCYILYQNFTIPEKWGGGKQYY